MCLLVCVMVLRLCLCVLCMSVVVCFSMYWRASDQHQVMNAQRAPFTRLNYNQAYKCVCVCVCGWEDGQAFPVLSYISLSYRTEIIIDTETCIGLNSHLFLFSKATRIHIIV